MSSLELLQNFYESSDSDEEAQIVTNPNKLPLPDQLSAIVSDPCDVHDDPSKHQGRMRSFKHELGNWATYVCLPYDETFSCILKQNVQEIFAQNQALDWFVVENFHVSLSRTVSIPHHFIEPLVLSLKEQFRFFKKFSLEFSASDLRFYINDERSRSFCGIEITALDLRRSIKKIVDAVDETFAEFRCESFYEEASFHISFAWCLGDITLDQRCDAMLSELKALWQALEDESDYLFSFDVTKILLKCGNKSFVFGLQ